MKFFPCLLAIAFTLTTFVDVADAGRRRRRRRSPVPAALCGGPEIQMRHNLAADADDLTRLRDRDDLERFIAQGHLVEISGTRAYYLDAIGGHDPSHARLYRHARPWTRRFLDRELGSARAKSGHRFKITSLVRTEAYQDLICRSGNGAAICGGAWWERSLHLTGATVDISKEGMSRKTLARMRKRLIHLQRQGLVAVIEERGAFHVFVRKAYGAEPKKVKKPKKTKKKKRTRDRRGRTR